MTGVILMLSPPFLMAGDSEAESRATGGSAHSSVTGGTVRGGGFDGASAGESVRGGDVVGGSATAGSATAESAGAGMSTATATVNGRKITAQSDNHSVAIESREGKAVITVGDHRLRVENTRLFIDDTERASFDAQTRDLELSIKDGRVAMSVDGEPALDEEL